MSKWMKWAGCLAALWLIAAAGVAGASASDRQPAGGELQSTQLRRPLAFEPNRGQTAAAVRFLARGVGYGLFITDEEAVFSLLPRRSPAATTPHARTAASRKADSAHMRPEVLRLRWHGGQRPQAIEGLREIASRSHLLSLDAGVPGLTDVPRYEAVALRQVYPGVDLIFYGNQGRLEYDFELAPGVDPSRIRLSISGASSLDVDADGALVVGLQGGTTRFEAPIVYQVQAGRRVPVASRYVIDANRQVHFELAQVDPELALVIDPIFVYSSYLGGSDVDYASGMALDSAGNVYVAGDTASSNFPTVAGGYDSSWNGGRDVFVSKFNANGNGLVYSTYFGAAGDQGAYDIAIDNAGNAWVTGYYANSGMFVLKLNANGNSLLFLDTLTTLNDAIYPGAIAVDAGNSAVVVGTTFATNLPTVNPYQAAPGGGGDGFLRKYSSTGVVQASTYAGGVDDQWAHDVAIGPAGEVIVTGINNRFDALGNVWVFKLDNTCTTLSYGVQFGGGAYDSGHGVTVDTAGNAYIVGITESNNFPTANALQLGFGGGWRDGFLYKINNAGARVYSSYIGGSGTDAAYAVALNGNGDVLVVGDSNGEDPMDDAYLLSLNNAATAVNYSAIFGGNELDGATAVAADASGNVYVMGVTKSTDFPVTPGAFQTSFRGGFRDGWVAKIVSTNPVVSIGNASVAEGDSGTRNLSFPVTISARSAAKVRVNWTAVDGSATSADNDYEAASGTLVIPAGQLTATLNIVVNGDTHHETDETFGVTLTAPSNANATLGTATATGTIANDDAAPGISIDDRTVTEGGTALFTVSLSRRSHRAVSMQWAAANGTATAPADYAAGAGTLTIPAGLMSLPITRATIDDALDEDDETFFINLGAPVNATLADNQGVCTIVDNDLTPTLSIDNGGCSVTEGNSGSVNCNFVARLSAVSGRSVSFNSATANGTATAGADYTAHASTARSIAAGQTALTIAVPVLGDTLDEDNESFALNLSGVANATPGTLAGTGTITDDDAAPTLTIDNGGCSVTEGNSGSVNCSFVARLSAASSRNISFNSATANGTATAGADYTAHASTARSIAAGQTALTIVVPALGDTLDEDNESFALNLSGVANATPGSLFGSGTITDDDAAPTLSIDNGGCSVTEGNSGSVNCGFVARLSALSGRAVSFTTATANGTATAGSDYTGHGGVVRTINPGLQTLSVLVPVLGDTLDEPNESFALNLTAVANASPGTLSGTGTIVDDDEPVATGSLRMRDATVQVAENAGSVQLVVERSGGSSGSASVNYATGNGSALAGLDYGAASGTLTWASGDAGSKTITLTIINDPAVEPQESFTVTLSQAGGAALGTPAVTTVTIIDGAQLLHANGFE